jgi:uncharacterized protein
MSKKTAPQKLKFKRKKLIYFIMFISLLTGIYYFFLWTPPGKVKLKIKSKIYTLEVAKTTAQKSKGLSGRESLCSDCGMIFTYTYEQILPFWMKDTYLPLDMIWLDKSGQVVHLETMIPPESKNEKGDYQLYIPQKKAQYVIELAAGQVSHLKLAIGDLVDLSPLQKI